jgi:hypothetical protein
MEPVEIILRLEGEEIKKKNIFLAHMQISQ